jgi:hypothetical protein
VVFRTQHTPRTFHEPRRQQPLQCSALAAIHSN